MWSISVLKNDVVITTQCAEELFKAQKHEEELWRDVEEVMRDNRLAFNDDRMEHMDFLGSNKAMIAVLRKHKVKGDICFGDLSGDNAGLFWGYRFDGKGRMTKLRGTVVFEEVKKMGPEEIFADMDGRTFTSKEFYKEIAQLGVKYGQHISSDAYASDLIDFLRQKKWLEELEGNKVRVCIS